TVDVSLLGLAIPFAVVDPEDPRMRETARAIERVLTREAGGIGRYDGDTYAGGHAWVIATLWLALYKLRTGDRRGAWALFRWVVDHRTAFDLLPEQVNRWTGEPCWVVPLLWSHAMYVWFVDEWAEREDAGGAGEEPGAAWVAAGGQR
ncbi:MAG: glycoside hydrolase family 15, partial [Alicyclobacillus sp.]|nr:glycoside hydrolase family 15 [Alicyclobacillus sp.]